MSKKSFDECYFTSIHDIEVLDDIVTYVERNYGKLGKYENSIFCPECRHAELSYVHQTSRTRAFLRRKFRTVHLPGCSYNYEYSSPKFSKEYYELLTDDQIQDKMASMMRSLLRDSLDNGENVIQASNTVEVDNPLILEKEQNGQQIRKSLRRKKLSTWLDEEIAGELHLFYGEVKLKVRRIEKTNEAGESYFYYFLDIFCENKNREWKRKTQIYRGAMEDSIDENQIYYFVAVGNIDFSNSFPRLELSNKQSILFKAIQ
ncbi:hypothetical protein [Enterococcus columbae]|uniref:Uncharacterized protein n=1 Tax=Enterococcus columbae DSM 7374 = ATCC 51263 TaxID=1121865 RepID=S0L057_9ENTE|nr:hypothetical protein [Enterococcus columbae]EOT44866.1 hypothetical protein OMW_00052 [Enterococcus columbae DSM 7374 = ATCC 51263]EOW84159.1 hypothetical protein I568_00646 [Enterococcus columbae DSM 7374 = ATCC 51263]